jgi:ERCC4-related helicase/phage repressor protein C with HTH and peptisase S24 domain
MKSSRLDSYSFKISYGPSDDRLRDFYIPALERSVRFDRTTGFFSSAALAIAAAGIVRLIGNGGKMRLLCGAQLSPEDVEAIRKGAALHEVVGEAMAGCLADPADQSMRARLEALAWMVAHDRLEIRVVLPRGKDGLPLAADEAREYFHPKQGLFEDAAGNKLAFTGSSNDSANGWQWNYEVFDVYTTWLRQEGRDEVPPSIHHLRGVEKRIDRLWQNEEESWVAIDIPEAARKKLLSYTPSLDPTRDPVEEVPPIAVDVVPTADREQVARARLIFRFLREAPFLPNAERIGIETSTVKPWPHQLHVISQAVERFPENFLFCDEVGLGKTIEAGLALRQLVVSGRVQRALLLVPKSVLKQWQEELYEKLVLNVPRCEAGDLLDVFDRPVPFSGGSVWNTGPILLASSQLAKRRERQAEVLAAGPWDLIIVDEAHHARRKDFLTDRYRPNRLLELLAGTGGRPGLKDRTKCLYLLTATPMQIHPVEVWDLLKVLGLGGRWGALQENFLEYFRQFRTPFADRNWEFILRMLRDFLDAGGSLDPTFCNTAERELGLVEWDIVRGLPGSSKPKSGIAQLSQRGKVFLDEMVRRHTPLRRFMWRNTRTLLRRYRERGVLKENVPRRDPCNEWIPLTPQERDLYDRIESYISDFYQKYEAQRKGLGFVMTVYRRRLTSSFYALRKSLERRRDFLRGVARPEEWLTDDDTEQEDLDLDVVEELAEDDRARFKGELEYVEDFLHELQMLGSDSKLERLSKQLNELFHRRETVIVFTQYTDTMDHLREELRAVYGSQVACYSGRGGERWDGTAWVPRTKENIKEEFRKGEEIKILLCTEAASEGLNLQTCGVLINYDMPWNPMRVEQRIGRIDRIGQRYSEVWIRNYFYKDTVEAVVYQRLGDRISWFEEVVGELQPILNRVAKAIERAAMSTGSERKRRLDEEIAAIRAELDARSAESLDLDTYVEEQLASEHEGPAPVTLQDLERTITGSRLLGKHFRPHPDLPQVYLLSWGADEIPVTFSPLVFDRYPNTVQLLSYGNPLLDDLLASAGDPPGSDDPEGIGLLRSRAEPACSLFVRRCNGGVKAMLTLGELETLGDERDSAWHAVDVDTARSLFAEEQSKALERIKHAESNRRAAELLALKEEARQVLIHTALIELAEAQNPGLFDEPLPYGFGTDAVLGLKRHGAPYKALLKVAGTEELTTDPTDPFFLEMEGKPADMLRRKHDALRQQGTELLQKYAALRSADRHGEDREPRGSGGVEVRWYPVASTQRDAITATRERPKKAGDLVFLPRDRVRPYEDAVPVYDLKAAAGAFGDPQSVEPNGWVEITGRKLREGMFVAQVKGRSMEPRIPDGAWCLFASPVVGSRQGRVVLVQHREIHDPDTGGSYTVKQYSSEKALQPDGTWRHSNIVLQPLNRDYQPICLGSESVGDLTVIAEVLEVLASG